jgi:hypothetical protein
METMLGVAKLVSGNKCDRKMSYYILLNKHKQKRTTVTLTIGYPKGYIPTRSAPDA